MTEQKYKDNNRGEELSNVFNKFRFENLTGRELLITDKKFAYINENAPMHSDLSYEYEILDMPDSNTWRLNLKATDKQGVVIVLHRADDTIWFLHIGEYTCYKRKK